MAHFSVELPEDVAAALRAVAAEAQSTPEALVADAVRDMLADQAATEAAIAEGEAEFAAGHGVPHEDVMRDMRSWAANFRLRAAAR